MNGPHLTEMRSSNDIILDMAALRQRMEDDGYLLILRFHNREHVMRFFDEFLHEKSLPYQYKWLSAVGKGDFTGAHLTLVYGKSNTTCLHSLV